MYENVEKALDAALKNWRAMSGSETDEAESSANEFEASFYRFIDALREWFDALDPQPETLDAFLAMNEMQAVADRLPDPLLLNFETEAELIVQRIRRIDEDKYD